MEGPTPPPELGTSSLCHFGSLKPSSVPRKSDSHLVRPHGAWSEASEVGLPNGHSSRGPPTVMSSPFSYLYGSLEGCDSRHRLCPAQRGQVWEWGLE